LTEIDDPSLPVFQAHGAQFTRSGECWQLE
jgi:hypothetical protein